MKSIFPDTRHSYCAHLALIARSPTEAEGLTPVFDLVSQIKFGGWEEIRTPGTLSGPPAFQASAIDHSATHPYSLSQFRLCLRGLDSFGLFSDVAHHENTFNFGFKCCVSHILERHREFEIQRGSLPKLTFSGAHECAITCRNVIFHNYFTGHFRPFQIGGSGGIRTHGTLRFASFQD